jgi:replication fork protection complex subunit Tof1/Swi1
LEIKRTVAEEKRIGVAVSIMLEQGKQDAVEWIKAQLKNAAVERQAWVDGQAAMAEMQGMSGDAEDAGAIEAEGEVSAPTIFVSSDTDERKEALFKDKYLRLFLTTLGLHRLGTAEDTEASWVIPSEVSANQLQDAVEKIQQAEFDPPNFEEGQLAQDLIRKKSTGRQGQTFDSDSESEREIDGLMFPPNQREARQEGGDRPKKKRRLTRRNQAELTEEQVEERAKERRRQERERNSKIKSQLIVEESDDEEGDEEFFRLEEERRKKTAGMIRSQLLKEAEGDKAKQKKKKKRSADDSEDGEESASASKKRKTFSDDGNGDSGYEEVSDDDIRMAFDSEDESNIDSDDPEVQAAQSEAEKDMRNGTGLEVTPSTSPTLSDDAAGGPGGLPLNEVSGNATAGRVIAGFEITEDDEEDEEPVVKPVVQRRNVRAGFIIDDSDDE